MRNMRLLKPLCLLLATLFVLYPPQASAEILPHQEQVIEKIVAQQPILNGKFVSVMYEDDFLSPSGQQTFTSKRQAVLPANNGDVSTNDVLVQTISGKLATVLVPSSTLEASLKNMSHSGNIVRILEVAGSPIESTQYSDYAGFHFALGGDDFDTPWSADDNRVISLVNATESKADFADVANDRWSAGAIYLLASDSIVSGVGNDQFSPGAPVTRAAFFKMLAGTAQMAGFDLTKKADLPGDISTASWAQDAAAEIKAYLDTQEAGSFDAIFQSQLKIQPNQPITRAEAAQTMAFFVTGTSDGHLNFSDWNGGGERSRVASLVEASAITGVGAGKFDPSGILTREQMASMAVRLLYVN